MTNTIKSYTLKNQEKRFMFSLYIGVDPLTGKEMRTTRRGFKRSKEAELALFQAKLAINNGTFCQQRIDTYEDIYNLWIKYYEKNVEESTFVKTLSIFKNHILPAMGTYKIEKINVDVCQKHVDEWESKLVKFRMVKSYASNVLKFAIKRGYIQTNPFAFVEIPTSRKSKIINLATENFYTREQLIEFLSCLKKEDNFKAFVLFRLLSLSGMRKAEALGLTWEMLDFTTNKIHISKAIALGKDNNLYLKSTKNGIARTIKMDDETMNILKVWKKKQREENLMLGISTKKSNQLVFSNERNEYLKLTKTRKWILQVQNKYKLKKITTHGLRHTHCSLLLASGATNKEAQVRLGHTDINTTMNTYAHVTPQANDRVVSNLENYLKL